MSDIRTVLVKDSVIADITPDVDFAVYSGAAQSTYQRFPSTAASNSSLVFSVQVPSENVVIDRSVMITSALSFTISVTNPASSGTTAAIAANSPCFSYGSTDCLQAFPLNSLFTTVTAQINNTTVSVNLQDVLPSLLKMNDPRKLARYNSMTPVLPDQMWGIYRDGINTNSNPLSTMNNAGFDERLLPRGAHPVSITNIVHKFTNTDNTQGTDASLTAKGQVGETWTFTLSTIVTEPIFVSPFTWGEAEYNAQGLLGINNMNFVFNIDGSCKRVFSTANNYITNIQLAGANGFAAVSNIGSIAATSGPSLLFKFLSTQPSDLIETKNVVPILDFPRYLTSTANNVVVRANQQQVTLTTSNLQLNQIPDKILINVRKPMSQQSWYDSASFLTITGVSINFNNQSGLLSSASTQDLWRMSVRNGSQQSFAEFCGTQGVNKSNAYSTVPTIGSLLVLSPAFDMSLPDYCSSGSLGNFNLSITLTVSNQFNADFNQGVEAIVICQNSGIMVTQQGTSAVYQGLLTKEMVLQTKMEHPAGAMTSIEIARKIGGNMLNAPLTALKRMVKRRRGASGGAMSAAGASGGGASGGRLSKHY